MPISSTDIAFVYSGGSNNSDPLHALGGQPSAYPIVGTPNNLFDDVTSDEANSGYADYRCFYIFNDSFTDAMYGATAMVLSQVPYGATAAIGFYRQDDQQAITVRGEPMSGSMTVIYESYHGVVEYDPHPPTFAANVEAGLNGLGNLSTIRCTGASDNGAVTVHIYFEGADGGRYHPELTILTDAIAGSTGIVVTKVLDGGPINAVAPSLPDGSASPPGVVFGSYVAGSPFVIGNLYPGDGLPIWVRRTTPAAATGVRGDGFGFRLMGSPLPVVLPPVPPTYSYVASGGVGIDGGDLAKINSAGSYAISGYGGVVLDGLAGYAILANGGSPQVYYVSSGGVLVAGISATQYFPWHVYYGVGGVSIGSAVATPASTTGIDFVSTCQIFGCTTFPISWQVQVLGTAHWDTCNIAYVAQTTRLDFDSESCSYRGIIGNGDPYNTGKYWYFELAYETIQQMWVLKSHTPPQISDGPDRPADCTVLEVHWTSASFQCCGANSLANSSSYVSDFNNDLQVNLTPIKYCTPKPCQYWCGKCCRQFKCPTSYTFTTYFGAGSGCLATPLSGKFTLTQNLSVTPGGYGTAACGWAGDIPGTSALWILQFDPAAYRWIIFVQDPTHKYTMTWSTSDRDFQCCRSTDTWTMDSGYCVDSSGPFAITYPTDSSTCS